MIPKRKNSSLQLSNRMLPRDISESMGKLPPQALELEEAVLGAMMLERSAVADVVGLLQVDDFYLESHKEIYSSIVELFNTDNPIDMRTVTNQLRRNGKIEIVGGAYYIAELTSKVSSAANIEYHSRVLIEMSVKRSLIVVASQVHQDCYEDSSDVFVLLDTIQGRLDKISSTYFKNNFIDSATLYRRRLKKIAESRNDKGITGIPTGFVSLDKITGGWQAPDLLIIAARPGMGKTVMSTSIARNASILFKRPTAIFSLEVSADQVMDNLISAESEIEKEKIQRGSTTDMELDQMATRSMKLLNAPIFIDDTPAISILELRAKCRRLKHEQNIELIIVDYLQLMRGDENAGNREQEIASISRGLKSIAKELSVPVIALSQLSRGVESRGGEKRPQLSDLRESGAIEQDADVVMFLYRPEYYKINVDENGFSTIGMMEVIIAKNRNGTTGSVQLKFIGKYSKVIDYEPTVTNNELTVFKKITTPYEIRDTSTTEVERDDDMPF